MLHHGLVSSATIGHSFIAIGHCSEYVVDMFDIYLLLYQLMQSHIFLLNGVRMFLVVVA